MPRIRPLKVNMAPRTGVSTDPEENANRLRAEHSRYAGHVVVFERSEGNDPVASRGAAQAEANMNKILDHWPNGTPRDHIAQYAVDGAKMATDQGELVVPENVVLSEE